MSDIEKLVESLADLIADKVAAKLGNKSPSVPAQADPPDVVDKDDEINAGAESEAAKPTRTRRSKKAAAKAKVEEESPADEPDMDLPTEEQIALVKEDCDAEDIESIKAELLEFYTTSQDYNKADAATTIAEATDEELHVAYVDFSARLLALQEDGSYEFVDDLEDYYQAERLVGDKPVVCWVRHSTTLNEEQVAAAVKAGNIVLEEEEEEEKPKPKKKRTRKKA